MAYEESGIKLINIEATTRYPIVSAFEFEFLMTEEIVKKRMSGCTLYLILQRPLVYFTNVRLQDGVISFEITDDDKTPLKCVLDLAENGLCEPGEAVEVEIDFYKRVRDEVQPFNDVAALKIFKLDGDFVVWFSPQKLLYEAIYGRLKIEIDGEPHDFMNYHVHYIGQAFSQKVWDRLAGHKKLQRILTLEDVLGSSSTRAPFEICLLLLEVVGFSEINLAFDWRPYLPKGAKPIVHPLPDDAALLTFNQPALQPNAAELTNEAEAMLINRFRPQYNEVLFDSYPELTRGTRSAGYTAASLEIDNMPAILKTDHWSSLFENLRPHPPEGSSSQTL